MKPSTKQNILDKIAIKAGWETGLITKQNYKKNNNKKFSFQTYIANHAFNENDLKIDAIYFSGTTPVIYIKQLSSYNPNEVRTLQRKIWNEGRTPLLLVITPDLVKIIDNYATPVEGDNQIGEIEIQSFSTSENDLNRLCAILKQSKLDSESVLGNEIKLKINQRVDKKLISQLRNARNLLHSKYKLAFSIIHDLLGRSLFTLYLEHRNILTHKDYPTNENNGTTFYDLLKHPGDTYNLFDFLKDKFNGDLFPVTDKEKKAINRNPEILEIINQCYSCSKDLSNNQLTLAFKIFDFNYIPIELISSIYEEFMSEEDIEKNIIKNTGAYYTPQMLVEFVYNEVLPMPSKNDCNYDIKILDPACGSGIFLVEGFKRIIERWKFANKQTELDEKTLKILLSKIYGIETHPEAIKVTAFSLYLTFLHHMNPKKILNKVKFSPLIYWTDKEEVKERDINKFGKNILQASTFILSDENYKNVPVTAVDNFFKNSFDIVIGNPPWKRGNLEQAITSFAKESNWDVTGDIVNAYLAYIPKIAPAATIALITSVKVLFNTSKADVRFRQRFFSEHKVSVVANFSVVRDVLFEKAKQAAALIIYKKRQDQKLDSSENFIYCIPKTKESIHNRRTIAIDSSEIKYLPVFEVLKTSSKIFKIAMFGTIRDLKFIDKLNSISSIDKITDETEKGIGLKIKGPNDKKNNNHLKDYVIIPKDKIQPYYIPNDNFKGLGSSYVKYRFNDHAIFDPPIILVNEGSKNGTVSISYVDYKCVYPNSVYGLSLKSKSKNYHKSLTVCMNSTLAKYYYFLISSNWGVSKGGQLLNVEAVSFPAIPEKLSGEAITSLALLYDKIQKIITSPKLIMNYTDKICEFQIEIDEIIYRELKITKEEKALIDNVLNYSVVLHNNYNSNGAELAVSVADLKNYAQFYINVLKRYFKNSNYNISIQIFDNTYKSDDLVCIKVNFDKDHDKNIETCNDDISGVLKKINQEFYQENNESIYYRKVIKYEIKNAFYLLKPNQKRFWTKSMALNDADSLIIELISQDN